MMKRNPAITEKIIELYGVQKSQWPTIVGAFPKARWTTKDTLAEWNPWDGCIATGEPPREDAGQHVVLVGSMECLEYVSDLDALTLAECKTRAIPMPFMLQKLQNKINPMEF
jgi:hypothetical protein